MLYSRFKRPFTIRIQLFQSVDEVDSNLTFFWSLVSGPILPGPEACLCCSRRELLDAR